MRQRWLAFLILIFAFIGLADSAYIAQSESSGTPLLCTISGLSGCNVVAASPYSSLFGIPLADYGLVFYALLFFFAAVELVFSHILIRRAVQLVAALGLLASAYFMAIQLVVINALCIYCAVSAAASLLVFLFALFLEPFARRALPPETLPPPSSRSTLVLPPPSL